MSDPISDLRKQARELVNLVEAGGEPASRGFSIPAKILEQHIAILGKTGSGKTYTVKGIAERLLAQKQRVCILDPTGVWWGLRSDKTGKKPAFPVYVFGGEHADLPLDARAGAAIAEIIATTDTSAVIDTRTLTVGERTRFFTDFAETLLRRNRGPLHLIIDEAHVFAPQARVPDPASGKMVHAANNLVSLGRGVGLRVMMISQRPAKLHKDSLTQAETLITLRLIAPQDVQAVKDWIGEWADPRQGRELLMSLPSLPTGQGWIWAPEIGMLEQLSFPRISTYDSSRAPDGSTKQIVLANIDLASIEQRLQAVGKDVEESDPKRLRARIKELERQLQNVPPPRIIDRTVISDQDQKLLLDFVLACRDSARVVAAVDRISMMLSGGGAANTGQLVVEIEPGKPVPYPNVRYEHPPGSRPILLGKAAPADPNSVGKAGLRRMLVALAQNPGGLTDSKLGMRADVSVRGGAFDTYLSKARTNGWLEGDRSGLRITAAGLNALGTFEPLPTGRALLDHWLAKLGTGGAGRMLDVLARFYPRTLTDEQLGGHAGISVAGGSFDTYLSRLRGFDLITGKRSELKASEEFFK